MYMCVRTETEKKKKQAFDMCRPSCHSVRLVSVVTHIESCVAEPTYVIYPPMRRRGRD